MCRTGTSGCQLLKLTLLSRNRLCNCTGPATLLFGQKKKAVTTSLPRNASPQPMGVRSFLSLTLQPFHKLKLNQRFRAQGLWETDKQKYTGIPNNPAIIKIWVFSLCKSAISNPNKNPWCSDECLNHGVTMHVFKKIKFLHSIQQEKNNFIQPNTSQAAYA